MRGKVTLRQTNAFKVAPAALTMSPNAGTEGETLNVTLTGWTFPSGTTVLFGSSTSGITVNSVTVSPDATQAVANITIAPNAHLGLVTVGVNNGQSNHRFGNAFSVSGPALTLTPNSGTTGTTLDVTMMGWMFLSGTTVLFGNSGSGITVNSVTVSADATQAVANITIAPSAPLGLVNVSVNNGQSRHTFSRDFDVVAP